MILNKKELDIIIAVFERYEGFLWNEYNDHLEFEEKKLLKKLRGK